MFLHLFSFQSRGNWRWRELCHSRDANKKNWTHIPQIANITHQNQHQYAVRRSWRLDKFERGVRHHGLDCNQIYGIGDCQNRCLCRKKSPRGNIGHCNQSVSNPAKKSRKPRKRGRSHTPNNGAKLHYSLSSFGDQSLSKINGLNTTLFGSLREGVFSLIQRWWCNGNIRDFQSLSRGSIPRLRNFFCRMQSTLFIALYILLKKVWQNGSPLGRAFHYSRLGRG